MSAKQGTSKGSKDGAAPPLGRRVLAIAGIVVLGALMTILDTTIVAVAIDTLSRDFGVSLPTIQWVSTAYMLALATVIPLTGWAIDRFGAKRLWMVSVALFAVVLQHQIAFGLTQTRGGGVAAAESVPPGLLSVTRPTKDTCGPAQTVGGSLTPCGRRTAPNPAGGSAIDGGGLQIRSGHSVLEEISERRKELSKPILDMSLDGLIDD